jgi:predicted AAA+ superfamily ATPase
MLRPVHSLDPITLDQLVGIDDQKAHLLDNTRRFLAGTPANNALLWGPRGTGKSSLIKALLNALAPEGLRVIEVDKDDLVHLPEIVDGIRDQPFHFIVFSDDLSFEAGDRTYKALKSALDGSIERPPDNVLVYATSNRRHLLPEYFADNNDTRIEGGEIHYGEAVEEKISLSDRFGLWIPFYPASLGGYLEIVDSYFPDWAGDRTALHEAARLFALGRGSRSGRTARQFFNQFVEAGGKRER